MKNITANTAILSAIAYARLSEQDCSDISILRRDGLYEIRFATDWMQYDCFVDEQDGEVLGFDCRPMPEHAMLCDCARVSA